MSDINVARSPVPGGPVVMRMDADEEGLPEGFWKTCSAFCNTSGGTIVLEIPGDLDPWAAVDDIWCGLRDPMTVSRDILSEGGMTFGEEGGAYTVTIEVPDTRRRHRPVYIGGNPYTGTYKWSGGAVRQCTHGEVRAMMCDSLAPSEELMAVPWIGTECLCMETVGRYRARLASLKPGHPWNPEDDVEFLRRVGAVNRAADGTVRPTRAGLLMFGNAADIVRVFPGYGVDYRECREAGAGWSYRLTSDSCDWSGNLYDFVTGVLPRLSSVVGDRRGFGTVEEAVMNAVIHASYGGGQRITVEARPDRAEVSNPGILGTGSLYSDRTVCDPRNPALMRMFFLVGMAEGAGTGIPSMRSALDDGTVSGLEMTEDSDSDRVSVAIDLCPKG